VVLMRSAGCVINDIVDRKFDAHVERTRERPLAAQQIPVREALGLAGVLVLIAFLLVLQINRLTILLSCIALLLAVIYPFLKRFFWMPQAWLGMAFGFGIPMAFAAHHGEVVPLGWVMLLANVFWVIAYDTEYAMVDRDDDLKLGLKSSAIFFGRFDVIAVMVCHGVFLAIMAAIGWWARLGICYFIGLILASGGVYAQWLLIRSRQRERCFKAFLANNWIGAAVYGGIALDFLFRIPLFPAH
jgi:4-hydroxybenzoate polyprenyltransferase